MMGCLFSAVAALRTSLIDADSTPSADLSVAVPTPVLAYASPVYAAVYVATQVKLAHVPGEHGLPLELPRHNRRGMAPTKVFLGLVCLLAHEHTQTMGVVAALDAGTRLCVHDGASVWSPGAYRRIRSRSSRLII